MSAVSCLGEHRDRGVGPRLRSVLQGAASDALARSAAPELTSEGSGLHCSPTRRRRVPTAARCSSIPALGVDGRWDGRERLGDGAACDKPHGRPPPGAALAGSWRYGVAPVVHVPAAGSAIQRVEEVPLSRWKNPSCQRKSRSVIILVASGVSSGCGPSRSRL